MLRASTISLRSALAIQGREHLRAGAGSNFTDPWTANAAGDTDALRWKPDSRGGRKPGRRRQLYHKLYPVIPSTSAPTANYTVGGSIGGNTNQFVTREDYNINSTTRLFGRFTYYGLTDLRPIHLTLGFAPTDARRSITQRLLRSTSTTSFRPPPSSISTSQRAGSFIPARPSIPIMI